MMIYEEEKTRAERQDDPMDAYNIRLTAWHARQARHLAEGNLSKGVRIMIEMAYRNLNTKIENGIIRL